MSNVGQAATAVVAAVIGFYIGGPTGAAYGFQLGLMAGSALFPTQLPGVQGPRLGDGQQTSSIVGASIPWVVGGTQRVGGIIIWASPIREVAETQTAGGKGAPEQSQTTYRYFRSFAILLCEPPDSLAGETIAGVRRIWANGKLILDRSVPPELDPDDVTDAMQVLLAGREVVNSDWASKMTFYPGSEDQMPDPVIESFEGVGNVPGYRGYSYVVFDDVELKPEDGNRIPASWSFEVYTSGSSESIELTRYSNEVLYEWKLGDLLPLNDKNIHSFTAYRSGNAGIGVSGTFDTLGLAVAQIEQTRGRTYDYYNGYTLKDPAASGDETNVVVGGTPVGGKFEDSDKVSIYLAYNFLKASDYLPEIPDLSAACGGAIPADDEFHWAHIAQASHNTEGTVWIRADTPDLSVPDGYDTNVSCGANPNCLGSWDCAIRVQRVPRAPSNPCVYPLNDAYCLDANGLIVPNQEWEYDDSTTYKVLQKYSAEGSGAAPEVLTYPLGPARPLGHSQYNDQSFWEAQYAVAVATGWMAPGLTYGVDYPKTQSFGYKIPFDSGLIETDPVSLATLVARICDRAGHRVSLPYDVADLEDVYVIGYQVSRSMPARSAIDVLRPVGYFDAVESGVQIKFVTRGKATVMTLSDDDLGAHFADQGHVPETVSQKRLEFELPRQIRVHYQNPLRDLDPGEEGSPPRMDTKAQSIVDVEIPAAIDTDMAAQIAEVTHRDLWASRYIYTSSVDVSKRPLEPTDCVLLPVDGRLERVRIASVNDMLPNLRSLSMLRDDDGIYVSTAVGSGRFVAPPGLQYYGPVLGVLLDLPPLDVEADDRADFYFAARPLIAGGAFRGATLSRSTDGTNFTTVASTSDATPMGSLVADLPAGPTTIFDWDNEIIVQMQHGELETRDEADVLGGANAAAVGADRRWEIVQFVEATEIADNVYRLRGLLRGRRGTEWIMQQEQTVAGDAFVMLSLGTLARVPLAPEAINVELAYRSTATGRPLDSAETQLFTGLGAALRPFSPVAVSGVRGDDDSWSFSWLRRDRLATDVDVPMSEELEDYEVDIMKDGAAIRTISTLMKSATYSSQQQVVDFGMVQSSLTIRVYQVSVAVGRSYPQEVSFTS